ncbi:phosphoglucomutase/phosphomannomutase PgmG [Magnetospirillum aberrantis]|uniref:Phosphomannomutase/phosphoglucomutase n=1 Tax=Magnetospirillum aberrantis SpK TaxID=908842 RepID=A0A7C9V1S2_9PROT|nr:phosphomannomutase/phosphoglucomutase [Magnetospirillum aberrantis]NFV81851.1 phosphomannomutase/phosphoglucomutase [Magnetospirillum aberrantis SpK]
MNHTFHPTILREYDIRGIVGETLFAADAFAIGKAFGTRVRRAGGRTICVGWDGRLSSPELAAALVDGLVSAGCRVAKVGRGPTPMLYYAAKIKGADGGIMVTGSHNPPTHNGFKMVFQGRPFFGPDIKDLGSIAAAGDWLDGAGAGEAVDEPVFAEYVDRLLADYDGVHPLKVVWDCGNGAAGEVAQELARRLPGTHTVLFGDIDGTFPNHHPDPTEPHNLRALMDEVLFSHAHLGLAFDGDGDRVGVVDAEGRILWGDQILVILAEDLLKSRPGAPIIADVKASKVFFDEVARLGGQPVMGRTGHSLIKTQMAEIGAPLAGEMSGHIFFADKYYGFDDALYAAIRLLGIVARWQGQTLASRRDKLPHMVNTPEMRFDCAEERKFQVVAEVKERLAAAGAKVNAIDGVRVDTDDGWWLLRASNTQAVLVARCEATHADGLKRLRKALEAQLTASGVALPH